MQYTFARARDDGGILYTIQDTRSENIWFSLVCKIPLLARALGLKAEHAATRPSARATIGYLVYKVFSTNNIKTESSKSKICLKFSILLVITGKRKPQILARTISGICLTLRAGRV